MVSSRLETRGWERSSMQIDRVDANLPIHYRGAMVGEYSRLADADLSALLDDAPLRTRRLLFAVIAELVRNAEKYGGASGLPSEIEVNEDFEGTYVEVASYGRPEDAYNLKKIVDAHIYDTDKDLFANEREMIRKNRGTGESVLGILQTMRRAKLRNGKRMVRLHLKEVDWSVHVTIRVYVE